jgi:hypothetical protein
MAAGVVAGVALGHVANIAKILPRVKRGIAKIGEPATLRAMAKRRAETVDDLLADVVARGELTDFARKAGISPWTLLRLRTGEGVRTHRGTVLALAKALGVDPARVRSACEASRAARK